MTETLNDLLISVVPAVVSSGATYFFTKRKYNAEVDSNEIQNLKEALETYKDIIEDTNNKVKSYIEQSKENAKEIHSLRVAVQELLKVSCVDNKCRKRKPIPEEEVGKYID